MEPRSRFGIYVNVQENVVVRISSPYWLPEGTQWVYLTADVNATLLQIRDMAREQSLVSDPNQLVWDSIQVREKPYG